MYFSISHNTRIAGLRLSTTIWTRLRGSTALEEWQAAAISRDAMTELFRPGEVLPEGRNVQEEERLIASEKRPVIGGKTRAAPHR